VLWKKVMPRLSAGRVQSVATRIVVERERERMRFVSASYWDLEATFHKIGELDDGEPRSFAATLTAFDGKRVATGRDFGSDGKTKSDDVVVLGEAASAALVADLADTNFSVSSVESKPYRRRPAPPFMTSTFQQEASRKLRLSSAHAMRYAQSLYEKGYITYMRTDSTMLSDTSPSATAASTCPMHPGTTRTRSRTRKRRTKRSAPRARLSSCPNRSPASCRAPKPASTN
jgi:DNA topoisomerase-1